MPGPAGHAPAGLWRLRWCSRTWLGRRHRSRQPARSRRGFARGRRERRLPPGSARQIADQPMTVELGAVAGAGDAMFGPPGAELGVLDRQLADEPGELRVVGVCRGLHAQRGDGVAGVVLPLPVHPPDDRVREQQPRVVPAAGRNQRKVGVQGRGSGVPLQDVQPCPHPDAAHGPGWRAPLRTPGHGPAPAACSSHVA